MALAVANASSNRSQPSTRRSVVQASDVSRICARVLHSYTAREADEITIEQDELVTQITTDRDSTPGWWYGANSLGVLGYFPSNYVYPIKDPIILPALRSLKVETHCWVRGVAQFNNEVFVVCRGSHKVHVLSGYSPFERRRTIKINGLGGAQDIVACADTCRLYVADYDVRCIWMVPVTLTSVAPSNGVVRWIEAAQHPWSLSVKDGRLLMTTSDGNELLLYDTDGRLIQHVRLPNHFDTWRAVETNRGSFIVCVQGHHDDPEADSCHQIAEVDGRGRVLRVYGGNRGDGTDQLDQPTYLTVDSADNVLVSDSDHDRMLLIAWNMTRRLERTVLLMRDKRKLFTTPHRFCLNAFNGLLVTSSTYSEYVNFYRLKTSVYP